MPTIVETGYLETPYLQDYPYLSGQIEYGLFSQVEMKINDQKAIKTQVEMRVYEEDPINTQVEMRVFEERNLNSQVEMRIVDEADDPHAFTQVEMFIGTAKEINTQVEMKVYEETPLNMQVAMLKMADLALKTQVEMRVVDNLNALNMQVKRGFLAHYICGGYLAEVPYLTDPYLAYRFCASNFTQVEMKINEQKTINTQVEMKINDQKNISTQTEMRVFYERNLNTQVDMKIYEQNNLLTQVDRKIVDETDDPHVFTQVEMRIVDHESPVNMQVKMLRSQKLNTQVNMVIYNITQLRILFDFISRGTEDLGGINWVSVQAIAPGDYSPNNLNTDIIEQRTQTDGITALWQLRCDTGNFNSYVDTVAILNHNFSRGASVEVAASDDAFFSSIKFTFPMTVETTDMYYIAPTLPNVPARYYQFTIQDNGNADGFLSIGTIVFGSAIIMTRRETYVNPVSYGRRHYKDTLETEGFTSVSNDRALRKFLNLTFAQLRRNGGNFRNIREYMLRAKTDLKALVIPRPTVPSALAVFAKMSQLPEELHNAIDDDNWHIDMTFDWDESL